MGWVVGKNLGRVWAGLGLGLWVGVVLGCGLKLCV